jgi:hypothetical protein
VIGLLGARAIDRGLSFADPDIVLGVNTRVELALVSAKMRAGLSRS